MDKEKFREVSEEIQSNSRKYTSGSSRDIVNAILFLTKIINEYIEDKKNHARTFEEL